MRTFRSVSMVALVLVLGGCGMFDDHSRRNGGRGGGDDRCDVDLSHWKQRARRFKDKDFRTKEEFRAAKDDFLHDVNALDTSACRRELKKELSDLMDDVRDERY